LPNRLKWRDASGITALHCICYRPAHTHTHTHTKEKNSPSPFLWCVTERRKEEGKKDLQRMNQIPRAEYKSASSRRRTSTSLTPKTCSSPRREREMNRKVPAFHPSIPPAFIENHKIATRCHERDRLLFSFSRSSDV
jgi:hypothetical protein